MLRSPLAAATGVPDDAAWHEALAAAKALRAKLCEPGFVAMADGAFEALDACGAGALAAESDGVRAGARRARGRGRARGRRGGRARRAAALRAARDHVAARARARAREKRRARDKARGKSVLVPPEQRVVARRATAAGAAELEHYVARAEFPRFAQFAVQFVLLGGDAAAAGDGPAAAGEAPASAADAARGRRRGGRGEHGERGRDASPRAARCDKRAYRQLIPLLPAPVRASLESYEFRAMCDARFDARRRPQQRARCDRARAAHPRPRRARGDGGGGGGGGGDGGGSADGGGEADDDDDEARDPARARGGVTQERVRFASLFDDDANGSVSRDEFYEFVQFIVVLQMLGGARADARGESANASPANNRTPGGTRRERRTSAILDAETAQRSRTPKEAAAAARIDAMLARVAADMRLFDTGSCRACRAS